LASNTDRRLDRLLPALSAKERALVVPRYQKAGKEPPQDIMSTMPAGQREEFNRLVRLMNAINCELSFALFILDEQVGQLAIKHGWLMSMTLCFDEMQGFGYSLLSSASDAKAKREVRKQVGRLPGSFTLPVDPEASLERQDKEHHLDWIARGLVAAIRKDLPERWCELRSIEMVIADAAEEFGEDPLRPDARAILDGAKETCLRLHREISPYVEPFELPEPTLKEVELTRRLVQAACRTAS
jgi:hypothetical protein